MNQLHFSPMFPNIHYKKTVSSPLSMDKFFNSLKHMIVVTKILNPILGTQCSTNSKFKKLHMNKLHFSPMFPNIHYKKTVSSQVSMDKFFNSLTHMIVVTKHTLEDWWFRVNLYLYQLKKRLNKSFELQL